MKRFDPPVFDTVMDWDTVLPTATGPKLTDGGDNEMAAAVAVAIWLCWPDVFVVPVTAVQPEIERVPRTKRCKARRCICPASAFEGEIREFSHSRRSPRINASLINGAIVRCRL